MKTRREFIASGAALLGTAAFGSLMLPVLQSCAPTSTPTAPTGDQSTDADGRIGVDVSDVTPSNPAKRVAGLIGSDGYPVMVTLSDDGVYHALSMQCTHQSATLNASLSNGQLLCPLHLSRFTLKGDPIPGSLATRPLMAYDTVYDVSTTTLKIKIA